jgi:hypothetical protein
MIHRIWRLSETSDHNNLGLACTDQGLLLGRTPLIERRDGRFVVRERDEIECLLSHAYGRDLITDRLMPGLATVAAALNANDQGLARIAAVHLQIPDLPNQAARDAMEAADVLIKYARDEGSGGSNWNPALHPRAGTPPNPGWFSPTDGADNESSPIRTAENDDPKQSSDASPSQGDEWVRLLPAKRIEELADFAEWLANATPEDEKAIRAEIKRYFADVGWEDAAHDLNRKLSIVLRPDVTREIRQSVLNHVDLYTRADPAEYAGTRDFLDAIVLAGAGLLATPGGPSPVWKLGWGKRGQEINKKFGDNTFPDNYPTIDKIPDGVATSVKSIDLNAATYHKDATLTYRLNKMVADVQDFKGVDWGGKDIKDTDIESRAVHLIVPKGSITEAQRLIIERVRASALRGKKPVDIIITEF